jgi:hypothetical protein
MILTLSRFSTDPRGTLGTLALDGKFGAFTLELPDAGNLLEESRIPPGTYPLELRSDSDMQPAYAKLFGNLPGGGHPGMIGVQNVPGRSGILIHCGNTEIDTRGCILVGDTPQPAYVPGQTPAILGSQAAYRRIYPKIRDATRSGATTLTVEP